MDWFLYDNGLRHERVKSKNQLEMSVINRSNVKLVSSSKTQHLKIFWTKQFFLE